MKSNSFAISLVSTLPTFTPTHSVRVAHASSSVTTPSRAARSPVTASRGSTPMPRPASIIRLTPSKFDTWIRSFSERSAANAASVIRASSELPSLKPT